MSDFFPITLDEKIAEVRRECLMRRSVYPRLVREKRMSRRTADRGIDVMDAVLKDLEAMRDAKNGPDVRPAS